MKSSSSWNKIIILYSFSVVGLESMDVFIRIFFISTHVILISSTNLQVMSEDAEFRTSIFEKVPSVVPLGITLASIAMAVITFIGQSDVSGLPIQFATSALWISAAGLSFSFYVLTLVNLDFDLDFKQEDRQ